MPVAASAATGFCAGEDQGYRVASTRRNGAEIVRHLPDRVRGVHGRRRRALGNGRRGYRIALANLEAGARHRPQAVGMARAAFDAAHAYANDREAFGTKIVNHQAVQFRLAKCDQIAVARQMVLMRQRCATPGVPASQRPQWPS